MLFFIFVLTKRNLSEMVVRAKKDQHRVENDWIEELKHGSTHAFSKVYDFYAPCLYSFCLNMSKTREETEEVVEDVFLWLWNHRDQLMHSDSLKHLLFLRTRHYLINIYRANINAPRFEDYVACCNRLESDTTYEQIYYDDFLFQFEQLMEILTDTQRKIIRLSKLEGYSAKEIAKKLNLSEQTVRNQLTMGVKKLRKHLRQRKL